MEKKTKKNQKSEKKKEITGGFRCFAGAATAGASVQVVFVALAAALHL